MRPLAEHHWPERDSQSPCSGRKQRPWSKIHPHICGTAQRCFWLGHLQRRHARQITNSITNTFSKPLDTTVGLFPASLFLIVIHCRVCSPQPSDIEGDMRSTRPAAFQVCNHVGFPLLCPVLEVVWLLDAPCAESHRRAPSRHVSRTLGIVPMQHCSMKSCRLYALVLVFNGIVSFVFVSWFF